jgi:hypothetical protein
MCVITVMVVTALQSPGTVDESTVVNRIDKYTEQQDHAVVWTTLLPMLLVVLG